VTVRVRVCIPPPHIRLHALHSLQALTWQFTGIAQGWVLHARVSLNGGQARPPLVGGWVTVRVRVCIPPPHIRLHALHWLQALTWQSLAGTQAPSRQTPPGQLDSFAARLQLRLLPLQLWHGPAQLLALQVPTQLPPWHSARLPVQLWGVHSGRHMPVRHSPPGQPVPGEASTHWSITHTRQGAWQLLALQLLPRQTPAPVQLGVAAGQLSGLSTQAPPALHTRSTRPPSAQRALPHDELTGSRWQPPLPSQPLVQAPSEQVPVGSAPRAGTLAQRPSCPGSAHDLHDPLQAVAQQRPWAHWPLAHWPPELQEAPSGRFPQSPITHTLPDVHCESLPQLVAQRLPLQPRWGAQLRAPGTEQRPPWQVPAGVSALSPASQRADWQTVPLAYCWQAPLPSHFPLLPQAAAPSSWHMPRGSTALFGAGVHLPRALGRAQLWQAPPQADSQQTPCTQKLLWH
jgi:hypothetical protein